MEHSLPSIELVRPWRRATMLASAVAALELVLLLVAGVALLSKPVAERVQTEATRQVMAPVKPQPRRIASAGAAKPLLPRDETSVLVLNGNGRRGAAASAAARVHGAGYVVGSVGNASRSDYGQSVIMYRPGFRREAKRLARDVSVAIVSPLDGLRPQQLLGAHVALVVGV